MKRPDLRPQTSDLRPQTSDLRPQTSDLLYEELSREDLIALVKQFAAKERKFGLVWEEKPENVAILCETKLPVLNEVIERHIERRQNGKTLMPDDGSNLPTHLLIEGDNYHALSVLNYTHAGKIDVIYIDPPYNTGNKDFIYNDRYVDKEDAYRHSKWLSFMEKRLLLAKNLLADSGVIFISIDDNEQAHLRLLCDEVFGEGNFIMQIAWRRTDNQPNIGKIARVKEYILCYSKNQNYSCIGKLPLSEKAKNEYRYKDEKGMFRRRILLDKTRGRHFYPVKTKGGNILNGPWMIREDAFKKLSKENGVYWTSGGDEQPYGKIYLSGSKGQIPCDFWGIEFGTNQRGSLEVEKIFESRVFEFPKPKTLIESLLRIGTSNTSSVVLDFFAGSGTTGHAVLELNASDGGNRQFILCTNNENGIAENVTYPRIKKVIDGYGGKEGIPAELRYFRTEFVEKDENEVTDAVRHELVERATDMLKIRENTFTLVEESRRRRRRQFEIYTNVAKTKYTAVIYDTTAIEAVKKKIVGKAVSIYIFTLGDDTYESDFDDPNWRVEPLPERILQVYKRLFAKREKK